MWIMCWALPATRLLHLHVLTVPCFLASLLPFLWLQLPDHHVYQQQQPQQHHGMRASRSCGNLAFMASSSSGMVGMQGMHHGGHGVHSPPGTSQPYGG